MNPRPHLRLLRLGTVLLLLVVIAGAGWWWTQRSRANATAATSRSSAPSAALKAAEAKSPQLLAAEMRRAGKSSNEMREILRGLKGRKLTQLMLELGRTDFEIGMEFAALTDFPALYKSRVVAGYAMADARAALAWVLANEHLAPESMVRGRSNPFLEHWAAGAFAEGKDLLYDLLERTTDPRRREDLFAGILHHPVLTRDYRAVFADPRAMQVFEAHERQWLVGLATSWARHDSAELLRYAATVEDPLAQRPLFIAAASEYFKIDPREAGAWALRVDPEGKMGVVSSVFRDWVYQLSDPASLLTWLKEANRDTGIYADIAKQHVSTNIAQKDFMRGLEMAATIGDERARTTAFQHITLLKKSEPGFADYVRRSGNPALHAAAALAYMGPQPKLSAEFIGLLPEGSLKQQTLERVRDHWKKEAARDPNQQVQKLEPLK